MAKAPRALITLGCAILGTASATGAAGAGAAGAAGNSGSADVPATLAGIKLKAATEINRRVHDLSAAVAEANRAKGIGPGEAALVAYLGADVQPLTQLNQRIQGDATVQQARQDFGTIFSGFRVYALVLPADRIAGDADRATATTIPALTTAARTAQQHVNPGNQAVLQPLIDDLDAQVETASGASNGLAATVLAYTPAQWNADHGLLSSARAADQSSDGALVKGRDDVRAIRSVLRGPVVGGRAGAGETTSSTTPTTS
jgi:hypothetical protein